MLVLDLAQPDAPMVVSAPPRPAADGRPLRLGLALQSPFDQDDATAHLQPTLDVAVDVAHGLAAFVAAGYRRIAAGSGIAVLEMTEIPVRAGLAYRRPWFELRLSALARPYSVGGAGAHDGVTWGGGFSGAWRWSVWHSLDVVLAAGLDVAASRTISRSINNRR